MQKEEKLCGIFSLKGIKNKKQIKIKHIDNLILKKNEFISDTLIKKYDILPDVTGEIYSCNITHEFLMISKKLPMMSVSVILDKPLRRILLFKVFLCFVIESEIKSEKDLINHPIDGKFIVEIILDGVRKEIDNQMDNFPGNEKMYDKLTNFTLEDEMKELIKGIIFDIDKKLEEQYKKEFEYFKPPSNIISLRNYKID